MLFILFREPCIIFLFLDIMFLIVIIMKVFYLKISSSPTFINLVMVTAHKIIFNCFVFRGESMFSFLEVKDIILSSSVHCFWKKIDQLLKLLLPCIHWIAFLSPFWKYNLHFAFQKFAYNVIGMNSFLIKYALWFSSLSKFTSFKNLRYQLNALLE